MVKAEIISIGSELLLGQIVDTNASWIAQRLNDLGVDLYYKTTVGDNPERMNEVLSRAINRSDVVITGGGLGPTQDDITREIIAEVLHVDLVRDPGLVKQIDERFQSRGLIMTANNSRQADIPKGSIPIKNPNGTAPAFFSEHRESVVIALPGVPFEMKWLFDNEVAPYLRKKFNLQQMITYKILKVADIGESAVDDKIGDFIANSKNPTVGVLAHPGQVDIRITAKVKSSIEAEDLIRPIEKKIRDLLGDNIFGEDEETLPGIVTKLLSENKISLSLCEDVTGGIASQMLFDASGSHVFEGLTVNHDLEDSHVFRTIPNYKTLKEGSSEMADQMALMIREKSKSEIGLAIHAIVLQQEHVENLSKGQTFISITDGKRFARKSYNFAGYGIPDRTRMSLNALDFLRRFLS